MSETEHTPGPWYADGSGNVRARSGRPGIADERVACRLTYADARLIAAAPQMLGALQTADKALSFAIENCQVSAAATVRLFLDRDQVRAAINEATAGK